MSDASQQAAGAQGLPQEVLTQVLAHLEQRHLLRDCARVSTLWNAAAAAALTSIKLPALTPDKADLLVQWLRHHGQHVTSIAAISSHRAATFRALPCARLRQLQLTNCGVQLAPGPTAGDGVLAAANSQQMTALQLSMCHVLDGSAGLAAIAACTGLRHLRLEESAIGTSAVLPGAMLAGLTLLTHLRLSVGLSDASLQHLSALSHLQELELPCSELLTPATLSLISSLQRLTKLSLQGCRYMTFGPDSTPALAGMTALQHLQLKECCGLHPAVLAGMTGLQHLDLFGMPLQADAAGTAALLGVLPALHELRHLDLRRCMQHPVDYSSQAYLALTASSHLECLQLSLALPMAAWPLQVFAWPQRLAALRTLVLELGRPCLTQPGLDSLAQCCPNLRHLELQDGLVQGVSLAALQHLPALTRLGLCTRTMSFPHGDNALADIAQLTGLRHLAVHGAPNYYYVTDTAGLLYLASLRQLTSLHATPGHPSAPEPSRVWLTYKPGSAWPRCTVWHQLLQWGHSVAVRPAMADEVFIHQVLIAYAESETWLLGHAHPAYTQERLSLQETRLGLQELLYSGLAARQSVTSQQLAWRAARLSDRAAACAALQGQLQEEQQSRAALRQQVEELHNAGVLREAGMQQLRQQVEQLQRYTTQVEAEREWLQRQAGTQEAAMGGLRQANQGLRAEVHELRAANAALAQSSNAAAAQQLGQQAAQARREAQQLGQQAAQARAEAQQLHQRCQELQGQRDEAAAHSGRLQAAMNHMLAELQHLQAECSHLQSVVVQLQAQHNHHGAQQAHPGWQQPAAAQPAMQGPPQGLQALHGGGGWPQAYAVALPAGPGLLLAQPQLLAHPQQQAMQH